MIHCHKCKFYKKTHECKHPSNSIVKYTRWEEKRTVSRPDCNEVNKELNCKLFEEPTHLLTDIFRMLNKLFGRLSKWWITGMKK